MAITDLSIEHAILNNFTALEFLEENFVFYCLLSFCDTLFFIPFFWIARWKLVIQRNFYFSVSSTMETFQEMKKRSFTWCQGFFSESI